MRINGGYKPWLVCAKDDTCPALACVLIERVEPYHPSDSGQVCNAVAVAADGYSLVVVPAVVEEDEHTPCLIPRQYWTKATKLSGGTVIIGLGDESDAHLRLHKGRLGERQENAKFPNWRQSLPHGPALQPPARYQHRINAELLCTVQRALDSRAGVAVYPTGGGQYEGPVLVLPMDCRGDPGGGWPPVPPYGIVMPLHAGTMPDLYGAPALPAPGPSAGAGAEGAL